MSPLSSAEQNVVKEVLEGLIAEHIGSGMDVDSIELLLQEELNLMEDILALDEALNALAEIDEQRANVVELRFFSGMTVNGSNR